MASDVDTTNSLATIDEAEVYFENSYQRSTIWEGLGDTVQSQLLIEATNILINYLDWITPFPADDYSTANSVHKMACFEQAWACYNIIRQVEPETKGISQINVDVIGIIFDKNDRAKTIPANVTTILRDYIKGSPNSLNVPVQRV